MRKILVTVLAVCTVLSMLVAVPITASAETAGYQTPEVAVTTADIESKGYVDLATWDVNAGLTSGVTYVIKDAEGLFRLAALVNNSKSTAGSTIYVTENITATNLDPSSAYYSSDINFRGIGFTSSHVFQGHFDGQGYTISKIKAWYSDGRTNYGGLFGLVSGDALIENVVLDNTCGFYLKETKLTAVRGTGTIAGYLDGNAQVKNCYSAATLTVTVPTACWNNIHGTGGIVGATSAATTTVANNTYAGTLTNEYSGATYIGGVVGYRSAGTLDGCKNSGTITVTSGTNIGGIAGHAPTIMVSNCENAGNVTATTGTNVGGIIGNSKGVSLTNCKNAGAIKVTTSGNYVGGIVGFGDSSTHSAINCENSGEVRYDASKAGVGGIYGMVKGQLTIQNCKNSGYISANGAAGGIVGDLFWATTVNIQNTVNSGAVNVSGWYAGGIVGRSSAGNSVLTVTDSANYGMISGTYAGGFVGQIPTAVTFKNCVNYGFVTGKNTQPASAIIASAGAAVTIENVRNYATIKSPGAVTNWYVGSGTGTLTADAYCADYSNVATHFYGYQTRTNEEDSDKVDLRFVGSIDSAEYYRAGFEITVTHKTDDSKSFVIKEDVAHAYVELLQEGGNITVPAYRDEGALLFALVVEGIPTAELANYTFTVETYSIAAEGAAETQGDISTPNFSIVR